MLLVEITEFASHLYNAKLWLAWQDQIKTTDQLEAKKIFLLFFAKDCYLVGTPKHYCPWILWVCI